MAIVIMGRVEIFLFEAHPFSQHILGVKSFSWDRLEKKFLIMASSQDNGLEFYSLSVS